MEMCIRPTTIADFPAVQVLLKQLWPEKESSPPSLEQVFVQALRSGEDYVCAEVDGQVVGFCATMYVNSLWCESRIAYVMVLVVDEDTTAAWESARDCLMSAVNGHAGPVVRESSLTAASIANEPISSTRGSGSLNGRSYSRRICRIGESGAKS